MLYFFFEEDFFDEDFFDEDFFEPPDEPPDFFAADFLAAFLVAIGRHCAFSSWCPNHKILCQDFPCGLD